MALSEEVEEHLVSFLAARLPRKGLSGRIRKAINPVRRYRHALRDQLAEVNEQVFQLIERDDEFYLQLIDPGRGGELSTIEAPVLLEDAKAPR